MRLLMLCDIITETTVDSSYDAALYKTVSGMPLSWCLRGCEAASALVSWVRQLANEGAGQANTFCEDARQISEHFIHYSSRDLTRFAKANLLSLGETLPTFRRKVAVSKYKYIDVTSSEVAKIVNVHKRGRRTSNMWLLFDWKKLKKGQDKARNR